MAKYLDKKGLSLFWNKVKSYISNNCITITGGVGKETVIWTKMLSVVENVNGKSIGAFICKQGSYYKTSGIVFRSLDSNGNVSNVGFSGDGIQTSENTIVPLSQLEKIATLEQRIAALEAKVK